MKRWDQRPFEVRNLFNPAFCAQILLRAMLGYEEAGSAGLPFSLSLLILPLCLHKDTRQVLSKHPRGYFLKALEVNPQLRVGFADRTTALLPYTFEALGLAMHLRCFGVTPNGLLTTVPKSVRKVISGTDESVECQRVARYLGRAFAGIGDRVTIYASLGVRP
jgi:hypothetical protein